MVILTSTLVLVFLEFGLASNSTLWPNLLLETNIIWKNWDNASGYQDVWEDNYTYALGSSVAGLTTLNVPGVGVVPITPPLVRFIQATLTQPFWQQQLSGGLGYAFSDKIEANFQLGYAFDGKRTIGGTRIDVHEFQLGAGFTWHF